MRGPNGPLAEEQIPRKRSQVDCGSVTANENDPFVAVCVASKTVWHCEDSIFPVESFLQVISNE